MQADSCAYDQSMDPAEQPTDPQAPTSGTPSSGGSSSQSSASSLSRSSANSSVTGSGTRSPSGSTAGSATRRHSHSSRPRIPTLTRTSRVERPERRRPDAIPGPNRTQGPQQRRTSISGMIGHTNIEQRPYSMLQPRQSSRGGFLPSPLSAVTTRVDTGIWAHTTSPTSDQGRTLSTPAPMPRAHASGLSTQTLGSVSGTSIPSDTLRHQQPGITRACFAVFGVPLEGLSMDARMLRRVFETLRSESQGEGEDPDDLTGAVHDWWIPSSSLYQAVQNRNNSSLNHSEVVEYFESRPNAPMIFFCEVAEELANASHPSPSTIDIPTAQEAVDRSAESIIRDHFSLFRRSYPNFRPDL